MIVGTKKIDNAPFKQGLEIVTYKKDKNFVKTRVGFKRYEKSQFSFGSDISENTYYSRGN